MGHFGFSYMGLIFMLMLTVPNLLWRNRQPQGYTPQGENKALLLCERAGQVCVTAAVLLFTDYNLQPWSPRSWWLVAALAFMLAYECWWLRYFKSPRRLEDFYSSFLGVPVAGATLPVIGFFLLGIYGRVIWLLAAVALLAIGHIGIHLQHRKEL